jgi:uncharacterized protein (DUF2062 family)
LFFPVLTFDVAGKTVVQKIRAIVKYELKAHSKPKQAAQSLGFGVFMGIFPIHGFQVATLMGLSTMMKLNRPLAFLGVCVSSPPLLPFIVMAALAAGRIIIPRNMLGTSFPPALQAVFQGGLEFIAGSVVLSVFSGLAVFIAAYPVFVGIERKRLNTGAN